jgi:DDE superfamily endonuclease
MQLRWMRDQPPTWWRKSNFRKIQKPAASRSAVDAKPSIQARGRCRPTIAAARGTPVRVEHEYVRHGALGLLAALDVRTGKVFAATPNTTGIVPFTDLIGQVMSRPEYKHASQVFVIVDNGSDHRGQPAISRLRDAHPNTIMIHTPVHASWLNQVVRHEVACR